MKSSQPTPVSTALATAAQYGWRVFPVKEKDPCYGCMWKKEATAKATEIKALFSRHPDADGYGIVLEKGTVVFDHDPHGTKTIKGKTVTRGSPHADKFYDEYLAPTLEGRLTATTPGGGLHIFMKDSDDVVPNTNGLFRLRGIDTRSKGSGYVVGANGSDRVWGAGEVRPMSKRLTGYLRKKVAELEERIEQSKDTGEPASEEDVVALLQYVSPDVPREQWLRVVWAVADNFKHDQNVAHRLLLKWSAGGDTGAVPQGFNKHPKSGYVEGHTDEDIWKQIDSDARRGGTKIHIATLYREALKGGYGRRTAREALDEEFNEKSSIELLNELPDEVSKKSSDDGEWKSWVRPLSKAQVLSMPTDDICGTVGDEREDDTPECLVPPYLFRNSFHILGAKYGHKKTALAVHTAYHFLCNYPDERCWFLSLEDPRTVRRRWLAYQSYHAHLIKKDREKAKQGEEVERRLPWKVIESRFFHFQHRYNVSLESRAFQQRFEQVMEEKEPSLVIVDSKVKAFPTDKEDIEGTQMVNNVMISMVDHFKVTAILLQHFGKDAEAGLRGSSNNSAQVNEVIGVEKQSDASIEIWCKKTQADANWGRYALLHIPIDRPSGASDFVLSPPVLISRDPEKSKEARKAKAAEDRDAEFAPVMQILGRLSAAQREEWLKIEELMALIERPYASDADREMWKKKIRPYLEGKGAIVPNNRRATALRYRVAAEEDWTQEEPEQEPDSEVEK